MNLILIRGGGDLASGVALRLHRCGYNIIIAELANPLAVRRTVSFSEAMYAGEITIEGLRAVRTENSLEALELAQRSSPSSGTGRNSLPVIADPQAIILNTAQFSAVVDARLLKHKADSSPSSAPLVIGLGPGFTCGENCHAVVETQRGHTLGRVYWSGSASADTGQPEGDPRRVLRAPTSGVLTSQLKIGEYVQSGQIIATLGDEQILAPIAGVLRGLIRPGITISQGAKIGDIDPRGDPAYCYLVSDKALAVGGGVLEALLSSPSESLETGV
jgi:xanthine dehydrogenase accessory factor